MSCRFELFSCTLGNFFWCLHCKPVKSPLHTSLQLTFPCGNCVSPFVWLRYRTSFQWRMTYLWCESNIYLALLVVTKRQYLSLTHIRFPWWWHSKAKPGDLETFYISYCKKKQQQLISQFNMLGLSDLCHLSMQNLTVDFPEVIYGKQLPWLSLVASCIA